MKEENLIHHSFRAHLQQILIDRCRKNPKYSLRAFARSLGIQSSALAEMLNGKRTITKKSITNLGLAVGLSIDEINNFLSHQTSLRANTPDSTAAYRQIALDQYALISDWYHYAIIELIKVKSFKTDHAWISRALGITKSEVNIAVERLLRLGLLEIDADGNLIDTSSGFSSNISGELTSSGSKQLQKQILGQSIEALESVSIKKRNHTSMTMAINPQHLPEAIRRITVFRRELCEYLESQGEASELYQLSLSLFPITNIDQS